ncbi:hypothetical protein NQ317_018105 [Molorchus minor]|uniref:Endonuclease/exonuclease/phosphatase domain-containing protein n=1 Tax=Molorchus minor TaxID=1323400 RepID=A0ABQ9JBL0_9CUCU|nr:hypothetical protein NQ317_018105 [Molorchus minor]
MTTRPPLREDNNLGRIRHNETTPSSYKPRDDLSREPLQADGEIGETAELAYMRDCRGCLAERHRGRFGVPSELLGLGLASEPTPPRKENPYAPTIQKTGNIHKSSTWDPKGVSSIVTLIAPRSCGGFSNRNILKLDLVRGHKSPQGRSQNEQPSNSTYGPGLLIRNTDLNKIKWGPLVERRESNPSPRAAVWISHSCLGEPSDTGYWFMERTENGNVSSALEAAQPSKTRLVLTLIWLPVGCPGPKPDWGHQLCALWAATESLQRLHGIQNYRLTGTRLLDKGIKKYPLVKYNILVRLCRDRAYGVSRIIPERSLRAPSQSAGRLIPEIVNYMVLQYVEYLLFGPSSVSSEAEGSKSSRKKVILRFPLSQKQKETRGQPGQKPENKMAGGPSRANDESPSSLELLKEHLMDARQQNQRLLETIEELKSMMVQARHQRAQDQEAMEFLRQEITAMRKESDEARARTTPAESPAPSKNSAEKSAAAENSAEFTHPPKRSQRRKAKRTKLDNPTSSSESDSEMEVEPAQESTTGPTSQPPQPTPAPPPKERIPPVILRSKDHWTWLSRTLREKKVQYTSAKLVTDGIRIFPASTTDYRQITKILAEAKVGFHTYSLPEEKQLRIVIRGLPEDLPETEIKEPGFQPGARVPEIQDQGYQPTTVQRMRNRRTKNQMPLVLVKLPEAECASRSREPARTSDSATDASASDTHRASALPLQGVPQVPQEGSSEAPSSQAHFLAAHSPKNHPTQANTIRQPDHLRPGRKRKATDQPAQANPAQSSPPVPPVRNDGSTVREAPVSSIKVLSWNVNGIRSRRNELLEIADRPDPDVIAIQETKIDSRHEFRMRGYRVYLQDRNIRGGGVAVLVKSNITHHQTRAGGLGNLEVIGIEIQLPRREPLHILSCYQPRMIPLLGEDLGDLFPDAQQVIAIGDFNAKSRQWNSRRLNARGRELEGFLDAHMF